MPFKIAQIFTNYGPYHLARIQALAERCQVKNWQVLGIEIARVEEEYPWQIESNSFPCEIITAIEDDSLEQTPIRRSISSLLAILNRTHPDTIAIAGYAHPAMLAALFWCRWHRKPAILLSESTEDDEVRSRWKEGIKSRLVKQYSAALVGGQPQKRYLQKLGMSAAAIRLGYDVVGNEAFHPDRLKSLPRPFSAPFFLAINRFVTKKNLPLLIDAYGDYCRIAGDRAWELVLCGDGQLRAQLTAQIARLQLTDRVRLPGFLQQHELLPYFAHAGCFVHASTHEQWGLVVNEAMAARLPVLVSNRCGCFEDLVIEGINGFGFNPQDRGQLASLMLKMSSGEVDLEKMSQAALTHIQKFSPDYFASGLLDAIEYAATH